MSLLGKPKKAKNIFRSNKKTRGSAEPLTKHPAAFPHQRYKDDPLVQKFQI